MANAEWKISPFGITGQQFPWRFRMWYAKVCHFRLNIHPNFVKVMLVIKIVSKQALQVSIYDLCITYCFFISDSSNCFASIDSRSRPTQSKRKTWSFHGGIDSSSCGQNQAQSYHLKGFSPQMAVLLGFDRAAPTSPGGCVLMARHQHYPRDGLKQVWVTEWKENFGWQIWKGCAE